MNAVTTPVTRPINLALQGGGSHGAFTWGVLDALLADERLSIDGISGASAGAVNAVALAHGYAQALQEQRDPRQGARDALGRLWGEITAMGSLGEMQKNLLKLLTGGFSEQRAHTDILTGTLSQWVSPYQSNPLDINPLRSLLEREIDFAALAKLASPKVFVSATHVNTGKAEIFHGKRLSAQAVMASACLPMLFQAVEIDGQHYWDGGYSGNPALLPLINLCGSRDIVLVQINPLRRDETPQTAHDILDRVNELTFNASLLSQMRTIDFINRLLADGRLQEGEKYKRLLLHRIDGGEALEELPASSKMSTNGAMVEKLFALGQEAGQRWLGRHFEALGQQSTVNIRRDYVGELPRGF
ncbi:patatin-like phospholipase family protein [Variovorax terrae]|uniref:Patatin-like phospholipase family protein n=1 Tax=Variovorax terrae TaxID=2923278 RepID=A0A9X1VYP8_9BURK|nr:patatin-like phospholipase family protein [Variovorax terrae]MCJ0766096.1 patatin-like phospholipase family protein [Variovorax terrae]